MISKEQAQKHIEDLKNKGRELFDKVDADQIKVKSSQLVDKLREIIKEGKARRIIIRKDDRILLEFPLLLGGGGTVAALALAPTLTAIGAIAALATDITVVIERQETTDSSSEIEVIVKD